MGKLPQEYISPFQRTRTASEETTTYSESTQSQESAPKLYSVGAIKRKAYDVISASTVFVLTAILLILSFSIDPGNPAIFESYGDYYIVSTFPFCASLTWFIMGVFFIIKAFRYNSCIYAKITSTSFFAANLMTLTQSIFNFTWPVYSAVWDFIMIVGVVLVSLVWLIKSLTNKE